MPDTRYHAVCLSNHARRGDSPWKWSEAYPTLTAAAKRAAEEVDAGDASLGFVVRSDADGKRIVTCRPERLWGVIRHYLELAESLGTRPRA